MSNKINQELLKLVNEYLPKRYYGHEARRNAILIAESYAKNSISVQKMIDFCRDNYGLEIPDRILKDFYNSVDAGWISVNDRLPEIDESDKWNKAHDISKDVWVYHRDYGMKIGRFYAGQWNVDGFKSSRGTFVEFWMPLPEPPKTV